MPGVATVFVVLRIPIHVVPSSEPGDAKRKLTEGTLVLEEILTQSPAVGVKVSILTTP